MLGIFGAILRTGVVTERYPWQREPPPPGFRGRPAFRPDRCDACGLCVPVCPSRVIEVAGPAPGEGGPDLRLDLAACVFCGRCTDACPREALVPTDEFELAAASGPAPRLLGRSLHLRHLDAGSCNACDFELAALLNPLYDVQRFGIDFVASPRHADAVVVTGPVTRNLEEAVRRTYEAMPSPRLVIAVGACACGGGIHGESYATAGGVDRRLPVDVYIPGCPPRPEAILRGLLVAMGRASPATRRRDG